MTELVIYGFRYSVYTWIVRATLFEKRVEAKFVEVNPFSETGFSLHPFGRVPLLDHRGFRLYETSAIIRYIDVAFDGPALQSEDPKECARTDQIIAIVDNYAYWPLVRKVFNHGYFEPAFNLEPDATELESGLDAAPKIISALDDLVADQGVMKTGQVSLADLHLAPMISYFSMVPEGAALLNASPKMAKWSKALSSRECIKQTKPTFLSPKK